MAKEIKNIGTINHVTKLEKGAVINLSDWQMAVSDNNGDVVLIDMFVEPFKKEDSGYEIHTGAWRITPKNGLQPVVFTHTPYFETETSEKMLEAFNNFLNNLHVYEELGISSKKRGVLLCSEPGIGKSSLINNFCSKLDLKSTCVLYIDSEYVDFEVVQTMFRKNKNKEVKNIVLIVEDIGGTNQEENGSRISGTLLNFLDGQEGVFCTPTLIVGTTNYVSEMKNKPLLRPGRFDVVLEVLPPALPECALILKGILKRDITEEELKCIDGKKFTPAVLKEIAIRHRLYNIPFNEAAKQVAKQLEIIKIKEKESVGFARITNWED